MGMFTKPKTKDANPNLQGGDTGGGGDKTAMARLRQEAQQARKARLNFGAWVGWKDLEEGNFLLMDIEGGHTHTSVDQKNPDNKYPKWKTPRFKLYDVDGNSVREGLRAVTDDGETKYYEIASSKKLWGDIEKALAEGHTVAYITDHELVDWEKKNKTFHKVYISFGGGKDANGQVINAHYVQMLDER